MIPFLADRGIDVEVVSWDDPNVEWIGYDLAVLRSTWDYPARRTEFVTWARTVPRLANPAAVIEWNTDKRYQRELADAGIPVIPTTWIEPGRDGVQIADECAPARQFVIKPAIGAGSIDSGRYDASDAEQVARAGEHVTRLLAAGQVVMVQPYLDGVEERGETTLMFIGGRFSHAVRKAAILDGPAAPVDGLFVTESISPVVATDAERSLAERALELVPHDGDLLYARVDLLPGPDDAPVLLEVELTEPSLFLDQDESAPARFADAIAAAAARVSA